MDDQRELTAISYLVHGQGGRVVVPMDWQSGTVNTSEGEDGEGNPVLIITVTGAGPAPKE